MACEESLSSTILGSYVLRTEPKISLPRREICPPSANSAAAKNMADRAILTCGLAKATSDSYGAQIGSQSLLCFRRPSRVSRGASWCINSTTRACSLMLVEQMQHWRLSWRSATRKATNSPLKAGGLRSRAPARKCDVGPQRKAQFQSECDDGRLSA